MHVMGHYLPVPTIKTIAVLLSIPEKQILRDDAGEEEN